MFDLDLCQDVALLMWIDSVIECSKMGDKLNDDNLVPKEVAG